MNLHAIEQTRLCGRLRVGGVETPRHRADAVTGTSRRRRGAPEFDSTQVEGWNAANTLHLDDLSRNFALNPRSGVKCKAYHRDKPNAARDAELPALAAYLAHVARASKGLSAFDHGKWRDVWKKIREAG